MKASLLLFLSPVLPYLGPEIGLVENTLVGSSDQFTCSKLLLGLVAKFCFSEYSGTVNFMIVLFSTLLFSKSGCLLELHYIFLHLLKASMEGVQY
jgi:hypothetical protein